MINGFGTRTGRIFELLQERILSRELSDSLSAFVTFRISSPNAGSSSATSRSVSECTKFGATFAARLRRRRVRAGDKWHLDEVALKIRGNRHWLWRAVDQHGVVLDILVPERRDQIAAERFLPAGHSTGAAARRASGRHKGLNNRAANSHLPTRKRERIRQRFKSAEPAQRFLVPFRALSNHFRPRRHRPIAAAYRQFRTQAHSGWQDITQAGVCC